MDYVLVAERSIKAIVPVTLASVRKHGNATSIGLIVPDRDIQLFSHLADDVISVIRETEVLPNWPYSRIADHLQRGSRAGWYLQQFLKLSFGDHSELSRYVIWDADTILLREISFYSHGSTRVNLAKEWHQPYFDAFEKLTGKLPVLEKSAISQYLLVETDVIRQLTDLICKHTHAADWIEGVLKCLPGKDPSEFSEYETYVNFLASSEPNRISYTSERWFRYGTEIVPLAQWKHSQSANDILNDFERVFSGYAYVAFERHPSRWIKRVAAHVLKFFKISS